MTDLAALATEPNMRVPKVVAEVGSGLNRRRKGLLGVLGSPECGALMVERQDRWARVGSECIEATLAATGRRSVVVDPEDLQGDLVPDMIALLTSMGARLCGRRSARHWAENAPKAACQG